MTALLTASHKSIKHVAYLGMVWQHVYYVKHLDSDADSSRNAVASSLAVHSPEIR